jgi:hypothetical protein
MATDNTHLAPQSNAHSVIESRSLLQQKRTALVARWLDTMAQYSRQEVPTGMALEGWFRSLESFRLDVIDESFRDYEKYGADENNRFWFPAPSQIVRRCERILEREEGKPQKSELAQVDEWKRQYEAMSPKDREAYDAAAEEFRKSVRKLLSERQVGGTMTDEQFEQRRRLLFEQAQEMEVRHRHEE